MGLRNKLAIGLVTGILTLVLTSAASFAAPAQFPNFFYGDATLDGAPAPVGSVVTAVVDHNTPTERHYVLNVSPVGKFGGPRYNQRKLKVGGDLQGNIAHGSEILFFVTSGPLAHGTTLTPAGTGVFRASSWPQIIRLSLVQN